MNVDISVKDFQKVCRVCLSHYESLVSIHEIQFTYTHSLVGHAVKLHLTEFLKKYSNVLVHKDDRKPQNVCQICINLLAQAFNILCLFQVANLCLDKVLGERASILVKKSKPHERALPSNEDHVRDHTMSFQVPLGIELASGLVNYDKNDQEIKIEESQIDFEKIISGEDFEDNHDNSTTFPQFYLDSLKGIKIENNQEMSSTSTFEDDCIIVVENPLNMDYQEDVSKDEMVAKNDDKHTVIPVIQSDLGKKRWDHTYCTSKAVVSNAVRRHKVRKPSVLGPKKVSEKRLKRTLEKRHKNENFECQSAVQNKNQDSNNICSDRVSTIQNAFDINNSSSFLPDVKYETSGYFFDNIENRDEMSNSYRKTMRWLLNYDSDAGISIFDDDTDQDRTYSPSSSNSCSSIDDELNENIPKKRPHKMKPQCCEGLVFQGMDKVIDHMKTAHPWTNKCILCGKKFRLTKLLLAHVASHAEKRNLVCKKCVVYCKDKESLELHYASEDHKSQTFKCKICCREFTHNFRFRRHIQEVHHNIGQDKTQCPECGLIIKYRGNLFKHLRTHKEMSERKSFLCEHCAKSFTTSTAVRRHVLIKHEGQVHLLQLFQPKCDYCSRIFPASGAFFKHRISHPECENVACPICDEMLPNPEAYRQHRVAEHSTYPCGICPKGFSTKRCLTRHIAQVHQDSKFTCSYCSRQFSTAHTLKSHEYIHTNEKPYSCQFCEKRFTQKHHVNQHISSIHTKVKKYKCHICSRSFMYNYTFKAHLRYHMGCKPFNCPYCTKSFIDTIGRHKHVKNFHPDKMEDFVVFKQVYQSNEIKQVESLTIDDNVKVDENEINAKVVVEANNEFSSGEEILTENYEELPKATEPLL